MKNFFPNPIWLVFAVVFVMAIFACDKIAPPRAAAVANRADSAEVWELSRTQQLAILELIRRDREIAGLRERQGKFRLLYFDFAALRAICTSLGPGRSYATLDTLMSQTKQWIDSGMVLAGQLDATEDFVAYATKVVALRDQQKIVFRGCQALLILFLKNGCDDTLLRKKYDRIL